jgi:single-strand DNA-binding protein
MNNIQLQGRLIKDPEVRYTQDGKAVVKYCLAVKREFFKQGEVDTDFINCVAFGKTGEFAEKYLRKGMLMLIVGTLRIGFYEKDGTRFNTADVIVNKHYFCGAKSENSTQSTNSAFANDPNSHSAPIGYAPIGDAELDDLPF